MNPYFYFVCEMCNAKWFQRQTASVCVRCSRYAESSDRRNPPWSPLEKSDVKNEKAIDREDLDRPVRILRDESRNGGDAQFQP